MKSVLKRGNVIMDNEIKNVFFDIEMLRRRLIRPFFIELGLTVGQGQPRILKELREHGIMNQKELADACLMDVTTMSRTLDRMEKDGLLKRENNPASRRSWNVLLTDYGSQKADEVIRIFNRIDNVIYNGFSEEEVQTLIWDGRQSVLIHNTYDSERNFHFPNIALTGGCSDENIGFYNADILCQQKKQLPTRSQTFNRIVQSIKEEDNPVLYRFIFKKDLINHISMKYKLK